MKIGTKPVLVATLKPNAFTVKLGGDPVPEGPVVIVTITVDGELFGETRTGQAFSWEGSRTIETIELRSNQEDTEVVVS